MKTTQKGFTLVELLIVIVIIGILASIVLLGVGRVQPAARDARRVAELRQVQNALELYNRQCGFYPGLSSAGQPCGDGIFNSSDALTTWAALQTSLLELGTYAAIPNDPSPGKNYLYEANGAGTSYILGARLEENGSPLFNGGIGGQACLNLANTFSCGGGCVDGSGAPQPTYCIQF